MKEMKKYRDYLITQINKASVAVKMQTEATPELVEKEYPDAVIVAVGADPIIPRIPGVENKNVLTAVEAFGHENQLGKKVVIIGGGMVGCELSLHLTSLGHQVELVEGGEILAPEGIFSERMHTLEYMDNDPQLTYHTACLCVNISENGITVKNADGQESFIEADHVILAVGFKPRKDTRDAFADSAFDVFNIGDCRKVGTIYSAVQNGFDAASRI